MIQSLIIRYGIPDLTGPVNVYIAAWFGLMILAIINGSIRHYLIEPKIIELRAHQISCFTGILLFWGFTLMVNKFYPIQSSTQAWTISVLWLIMTVIFEFGFGHYIMKNPWSKLLADYNLLKGRLWVLVLIYTTISPYLVYIYG